MKTLLRFVGLLGGLSLCSFSARANLEIGTSVHITAKADFDAPLAARGTWVEVHPYGRCWHPAGVLVEWRPYCEGEWVWTDCGWYWESGEPWAWACYHYGRWVDDPEFGWVWVPDIEWAPAWVYWRTGGGYIGWAPCPPAGVVLAPGLFAFVEVGRFNEPVRPRSVIVNNATIISRTTVINNIRHETRTIGGISRQVVVNEGPGVAVVQKATGRTAGVVPIQEAARRTPAPAAVMGKPWPSASQPKPLPSQRKDGFPPTRALEPQPKGTDPNVPSSKDGHPGDSHHNGRVVPAGGGTHPSATEHKIRDEPPGKNHEQGTRSEKGQGHE